MKKYWTLSWNKEGLLFDRTKDILVLKTYDASEMFKSLDALREELKDQPLDIQNTVSCTCGYE